MTVLLLSCAQLFAQNRTVSGKVTDEKGNPIPFATVKVKGSKKGTFADAGGLFTVEVGKTTNVVLIISSQGFEEKEIPVTGNGFQDISLKSTGELQEVVVTTALGIKRSKNKLPYAAQVVTGDDASRSRSANFINNLSGRVAGLDIKQSNTLGGSTNVVLRGNKTISGNNQALFVVDGVPYDNTAVATAGQRSGRGGYDYGNAAADINPDDIESITVLKGPAASALYGSRGFNGVILVTTKKASKGLGVTINSGVTFVSTDRATFPKYQQEYGGGYGPYYEDPSGYFLYRDPNNGFAPAYVTDANGNIVNWLPSGKLVYTSSEDASYGAKFDASKMVYQADAFDPSSPNFGKATPWLPAKNQPWTFLEKPINYNNSIFIEGGSDKSTFKLGYTRNDDKGILPNSKITKDQLSFGGTLNLTNRLSASTNLNYTKTAGIGRYATGYSDPGNPFGGFRQWWQMNTDIMQQKNAYFSTGKNITWNWADPTDITPIYWDNLYFNRYENYETDMRNRYFGNITLNYKATDWLNLMGRVSIDQYDALQEERTAIGSLNPSGYVRTNSNRKEINYDFLASFDKNLTNDINLKALAGINIRTEELSTIASSTNGGLVVPKLYSISNSKNPIGFPSEFLGRRRVEGIFGGVTLGYKDYITLDGTLRRDVSSTLPDGNNSYVYPSISAGFIFSNLIKSVRWISYGKLRGNYAKVGNDAPYYSTTDTYNSVPFFGSETLYASSTTKNNNQLKPENNKSSEVGLEMAFLKNRVGFDVTYYDAKSFNQILPVQVSRATGYDARYVNSGTVQNKGIELSAYGTPVKTTNFTWDIRVNWSRNRNKVVELFDDGSGNKIDNIVLNSFQGGVTLNATLGQPYGLIKGNDFVYYGDPNYEKRDPAMRIVGSNGRYLLTSASNYTIGDPNPDWLGSVSNTFKYKNFTFGFLIDVRHGGDIFSLDMYYGLATGLYPETAGLNDKGHELRSNASDFNGEGGILRPGVDATGKPNTVRASATTYGAYGYRYSPAAGFVYDGSYVKLREASLNYSFPKSLVSKIGVFKGIDISVIGRNLWIIHKNLPYSDPEESYGSGNTNGYQGNAYPSQRAISVNLKLKF